MLQLIRKIWQPRVSVVHFRRRSASYGQSAEESTVPWWAETSGKGGNLAEAAELAEAYAQIIKTRNAEKRAAKRQMRAGQRTVESATPSWTASRFWRWLQGQTPRKPLGTANAA